MIYFTNLITYIYLEFNLLLDQNLEVSGPSGEVTYRNEAQRNVEMHEVASYDDDLYEDLNPEEIQDVQRELYASTADQTCNEEAREPVQSTSSDQGGTRNI